MALLGGSKGLGNRHRNGTGGPLGLWGLCILWIGDVCGSFLIMYNNSKIGIVVPVTKNCGLCGLYGLLLLTLAL